jgi:hypothetical protein
MGQPAPEHVRQDDVEAVVRQHFRRAFPIAGIRPGARMIPNRAAFALGTGVRTQVSPGQQVAALAGQADRAGEIVARQMLQGRGSRRQSRLRQPPRFGVSAGLQECSQLVQITAMPHAFRTLQRCVCNLLPQRRGQVAQDRCHPLRLPVVVVGKENVAEERAAIAQQHRRPVGRLAGVVVPPPDDPRIMRLGLGDGDVPRGLPHTWGQARDVVGLEADFRQLSRTFRPHVLAARKPQSRRQRRMQLVAHQQLAARLDVLRQSRGRLVAQPRVVRQDRHRPLAQRPALRRGHRRLVDRVRFQAQACQHGLQVLGDAPRRSQFRIIGFVRRAGHHQREILLHGSQSPQADDGVGGGGFAAAPERDPNPVDLIPARRSVLGAERGLGKPQPLPAGLGRPPAGTVPAVPAVEVERHACQCLRRVGLRFQHKASRRAQVQIDTPINVHASQFGLVPKRGWQLDCRAPVGFHQLQRRRGRSHAPHSGRRSGIGIAEVIEDGFGQTESNQSKRQRVHRIAPVLGRRDGVFLARSGVRARAQTYRIQNWRSCVIATGERSARQF